jgi:tetratricopeptide (TPR) repeat protein
MRRLLGLAGVLALTGCAGAKPTPEARTDSAAPEAPPAPDSSSPGAPSAPAHTTAPAAVEAVQPPPQLSADLRVKFDQATAAARADDDEKAARLFAEVVDSDPRQAFAAYNEGICRERLGNTAAAEQAYRKALAARPNLAEASENLTHLYLRTGHAAQAENELRTRLAHAPNDPALHAQLAEVLSAQGRYEDAVEQAKMALRTDERNVPAMLALSQVYYRQKRFELARMVADNARQIDPSNAETYLVLGFLDLADKNQALAMENFKRAVDLRSDLVEGQNDLGALLVQAQDYPAAIRHLQIAVREAPYFVPARLNLGNAYRGDKQYDLARREYEQVLKMDTAQRDAYFNLGVLYLDGEIAGLPPLDRLGQSVAFLERFKSTGGQDPRLDQYLRDAQKAITQEKRRQEVEAKNKLRKAQEAAKPQSKPSTKLKDTSPPSGGKTPPASQGDKLMGGK